MPVVTRGMHSAFAAVIFAGIGCAVACKPAAKEQAPVPTEIIVPVTVALVFTGPIAESFEITGTIQPLEEAKIVPGVTGRVAKAPLKEGDTVRVGQLLFRLDRLQARAAGKPAAGAAATARTVRKNAEIRSPLAGVVLAQYANPGDRVLADPPTLMALVADIDLMKLTALLPAARLAEVQGGQEVTITSDALPGRGFSGRVESVAPIADAAAAASQVEIRVENQDHALRPGLPTRARVFTSFKSWTILVPPAALSDGHVMVAESGRARRRAVQTGIRTEETVEVLSGVVPGELVVVSGNKGLNDGARISYQAP